MPATDSNAQAHPNDQIWYDLFANEHDNALRMQLKKKQEDNMSRPAATRCKLCYAPFGGVGGLDMETRGPSPSSRNPLYCSDCDVFLRKYPGGAEVDMTIVFLDVRGSSRLAHDMAPREFSLAMQSFYNHTFPVLYEHDGFITSVRGDGAMVTFPPGFSGAEHASKAVRAACAVQEMTIEAPDGTPIRIGVGIHTGRCYIGTMTGQQVGVEDVTCLGDAPNFAAALCASAKSGEVLMSAATLHAARVKGDVFEHRMVEIKGRNDPQPAFALSAMVPWA